MRRGPSPTTARSLVALPAVNRRAIAVALVALLGVAPALAQADDKTAAGEAYDRGQRAFDAGRFREAVEEFRTADRLSPSAPALEAAIESASRADDPGMVMELCETADARPGDAHLEGVARDARIRFEGRAGKLLPRCSATPPSRVQAPPTCSFRVANEPWTPGVARWISAGDHVVVVDRGRGEERFAVPVGVRSTVEWSPPEPPPGEAKPGVPVAPPPPPPQAPPPAPPDETSAGGLSPAWFFVALGGTVVLGGVATGTGVATLSEHDDFETSPTQEGRDSGLVLQNTTNGLLAGAAACGVATVILAFVVDWSGGEPASTGSSRGVTLSRF